MRVDLHIHTTASDSCWTPQQVVEGIKSLGVGLFAVTDHDTTASVNIAGALAREAGLAFLTGVEISTIVEERLFHILGYGIDISEPVLAKLIQENRAKLEATDEDDIHYLISLGYTLDLEAYAAYEYERSRGGWKSLNYLIDHGFCKDLRDYMHNIRAKLPQEWPDFVHPTEAIAAIRRAGGTPILAHPGASLKHSGVTETTLAPFLDYGIAGLECYSKYHSDETTAFCIDWCTRHNQLITGGSDYHGGFVNRQLGFPVVDIADLRLGELESKIIQ